MLLLTVVRLKNYCYIYFHYLIQITIYSYHNHIFDLCLILTVQYSINIFLHPTVCVQYIPTSYSMCMVYSYILQYVYSIFIAYILYIHILGMTTISSHSSQNTSFTHIKNTSNIVTSLMYSYVMSIFFCYYYTIITLLLHYQFIFKTSFRFVLSTDLLTKVNSRQMLHSFSK